MTKRRAFGLALAAALFLGLARPAAAQAVAEMVAVALDDGSSPIVLDGELNDEAWQRAAPVSAFVQRDPSEGSPATFKTEARVVHDSDAIYVGVRALDSEPERIVGFLTRRDAGSASDWIQVYIDSYHDRRTAYQFGVNPAGVKQDSYWYNDNNNDSSWDAVWEVVVKRHPDGWTAEFRIPFSQLRFSSNSTAALGFAITRNVARLNETSTWPLLSKSASGWVSSFGELKGVTVGRASKRLEIVPYAVAEVVTEPREPGNPIQKTTDPGASFGADLKYAVTPSLTLNGTINPDFGQVEADPAVVNLSAFETFFDEKRPFFIEGSGNYQFDCRDCSLFYSRRIGRTPRGEPVLLDGDYSVQPRQSTIMGAAKLTGRIRDFSVGMLTAVTEDEEARIARGIFRERQMVEPQTFYSVTRARREFSDRSSLGFILTTTNRQLVTDVEFLPESAVTGGVDYDWRIGRRWSLAGYWAGSDVRGSTEAIKQLQENNVHSFQRPDADHLELDPLADNMRGHSGVVRFGKIAGERTRMNLDIGYRSPGFEVNDLGFERRADEIPQYGWLQIRWDKPGKYVRNTRINFNQWSSRNFGGDLLELGGNFNAHWQFQNFWNTGFGVNANDGTFDDRLTRGGPGGYRNRNLSSWQYLSTDSRRFLSFGWDSWFGGDGYGRGFEFGPRFTLRPTSAFSTEIGTYYRNNIDDAQWVNSVVDGDTTHYVFGRLAQKTNSITLRVNYTMTPNLSLQVYAQPFVSSGIYANYKELVNGRAKDYADRYAPFAYNDNADFKVLSFRTTNVLRWEYRPGSTLFVVWQQGREGTGYGRFQFSRDYSDVFSTPSTNTFLVKLAYWLNP